MVLGMERSTPAASKVEPARLITSDSFRGEPAVIWARAPRCRNQENPPVDSPRSHFCDQDEPGQESPWGCERFHLPAESRSIAHFRSLRRRNRGEGPRPRCRCSRESRRSRASKPGLLPKPPGSPFQPPLRYGSMTSSPSLSALSREKSKIAPLLSRQNHQRSLEVVPCLIPLTRDRFRAVRRQGLRERRECLQFGTPAAVHPQNRSRCKCRVPRTT